MNGHVGSVLREAASRWPDRVAVVAGPDRCTYRELLDRADALGSALLDRGVPPGGRVVAHLPNGIDLLVLVLAAWQVGAVAVPVLPAFRQWELTHILRATEPAVVATTATRGDRHPAREFDEILAEHGLAPKARFVVGGTAPGWHPLPTRGEPAHRPAGPDECCLVLFTSGTTSEPKGVQHNSRSLLAEARTHRDGAGLDATTPVLIPAPVAHIGSVVACTLLPCLTGAPTVVLETWDADEAVRVIERERVALAIGAPIFLSEILDRYERGEGREHRIPMFHTGAAPTAGTVIRRAGALGVTAWRAWGMTEAPTMSLGGPGAPLDLRTDTDGRITPGSEVQAVDENGVPVPPGTPGELRVRGDKLMLGYLDPAQQAAHVDGDGWFRTGDIGILDEQGWVTIRGRLKDVINRGGEKFSAAEIESAIGSHPSIGAVAVLGVPDPRLGERVAAFVTVAPGHQWPGEDALLAYLRDQHLARQKLPAVWQVRAELPRTATGKLRKRDLLEEWLADAETR